MKNTSVVVGDVTSRPDTRMPVLQDSDCKNQHEHSFQQ
jgi:hypothetical protein